MTKWLKYDIITALKFNFNFMCPDIARNRAIGENARNFRADRAMIKAETVKADEIGAQLRIIKMRDAMAKGKAAAGEGFMDPNVGKAVGDAFSKFEGQ